MNPARPVISHHPAIFAISLTRSSSSFLDFTLHIIAPVTYKINTRDSERQIGDFYDKRLSHVASEDCNLKSIDLDVRAYAQRFRASRVTL